MTKQAYETFTKNFFSFFKREHIELMGSADCTGETFFSSQPCDCCGSKLGGNRESYVAVVRIGDGYERKLEIEICSDCVYFNEYGAA